MVTPSSQAFATAAAKQGVGCTDSSPRVEPGVIWYRGEGSNLIINTYRHTSSALRSVEPVEIDLLAACDGSRSVAEIALYLGVPEQHVLSWLAASEAEAPEMFSFPGEPGAEQERERRAALRKLRKLAETLHEARSCSDALAYHLEGIDDGFAQFDSVELTVSHLYREPHPALRDLSYGQALADKLLSIDAIPRHARILEVGCGTGLLARNLLGRIAEQRPDLFSSLEYAMFDLSPALQATQRNVCCEFGDRVRFASGDIEGFSGGTYDLVLSNEVIADLRVGVAGAGQKGSAQTEAEYLKARYALSPISGIPTYVVNVGTIRFLEKLAALINPGGMAILTEYGTLESFSKVVRLHGHNEYSIQFKHLAEVAAVLGIESGVETLGDFLGFDGSHRVLQMKGEEALCDYLFPFLGIKGPYTSPFDVAYLRSRLGARYSNVGNLCLGPLAAGDSVLNPFKFYALSLRL